MKSLLSILTLAFALTSLHFAHAEPQGKCKKGYKYDAERKVCVKKTSGSFGSF
jgi:hypothetical protein